MALSLRPCLHAKDNKLTKLHIINKVQIVLESIQYNFLSFSTEFHLKCIFGVVVRQSQVFCSLQRFQDFDMNIPVFLVRRSTPIPWYCHHNVLPRRLVCSQWRAVELFCWGISEWRSLYAAFTHVNRATHFKSCQTFPALKFQCVCKAGMVVREWVVLRKPLISEENGKKWEQN